MTGERDWLPKLRLSLDHLFHRIKGFTLLHISVISEEHYCWYR